MHIYFGIYLCVHIISAFLPLPLCLTALHPFITLQVLCGTCHHTTAVLQHSGASLYSTLAASHSTLLHVLTALQLYPSTLAILLHTAASTYYCSSGIATAASTYYCSTLLHARTTLVALQHSFVSTYYCSTLLHACTTLWLRCSTLLRPFTALWLNCGILPQSSIHALPLYCCPFDCISTHYCFAQCCRWTCTNLSTWMHKTQTHKYAHIHIIGASYLEKSRRIASIFVLGTPLNKFAPALPG